MRLHDFQSVLSQAAAIAPADRSAVVMALPASLRGLPDDSMGACVAELRELTADMPPGFRKTFLQQLLVHLVANLDDSPDTSSGDGTMFDAVLFGEQHREREQRSAELSRLLARDLDEKSLRQLGLLIKAGNFSNSNRLVIGTVITGLHGLDTEDQEKVIALFDDAGVSCLDVLGTLMHPAHTKEIGELARKTGLSLSALYLGVLTSDPVATQKLLRILGRVPLPLSLHVYLSGKIGDLLRTAPVTPTTAMAGRALLLEIISISHMSETNRCMLMHAVTAAQLKTVSSALNAGGLKAEDGAWLHAHQIIAKLIDIGTCHALVKHNDDGVDLASYTVRADNLLRDSSVRAIVDQGVCKWDAPSLRALILGKTDIRKIKEAVFNVLTSRLSYDAKLAVLKGETAPIGESVETHVWEVQFKTAVQRYTIANPGLALDNNFAYEVVAGDRKEYESAYKKLTSKLGLAAMSAIRAAADNAMITAQQSRLPAMHVAAISGNSALVKAYLETVAGCVSQFPEEEIAGFLELSSNGTSLFHHAMIKGTADVIGNYITVILDAEFSEKTKFSLLDARRKPFNLGAFYILMSGGEKERAMRFVKCVLENNQIEAKTKVILLQCAKRKASNPIEMDKRFKKEIEQSAAIACAEAQRKKHLVLVGDFMFAVERSDKLDSYQKAALQNF